MPTPIAGAGASPHRILLSGSRNQSKSRPTPVGRLITNSAKVTVLSQERAQHEAVDTLF